MVFLFHVKSIMGKTNEEKLLRYIKLGKLHRIRSLLKKGKIVEVNSIVDDRGRTPLHISCLLGDDAVVRLLLQHGVDIQTRDNDGNTPVHLALNYALQTTRLAAYSDLILPLLRAVEGGTLDFVRNNEGVSASELLVKLKETMRTRREERKMLEEEEIRKREESLKRRREEKEWKKKISCEAKWESVSSEDHMNDYSDNDIESYDDWVERIRNARSHKHRDKRDNYHEAEEKKRAQKREATERRTKQLEAEHQAYQERISAKREQAKLATMKTDYESRCEKVFGDNTIPSLTIKDIPWPCDGNPVEMGNLLLRWAQLDEQDVKKFMKGQQVRWHPDRFVQRCGDRLVTEERDIIMDKVKGISQQINDLLTKM